MAGRDYEFDFDAADEGSWSPAGDASSDGDEGSGRDEDIGGLLLVTSPRTKVRTLLVVAVLGAAFATLVLATATLPGRMRVSRTRPAAEAQLYGYPADDIRGSSLPLQGGQEQGQALIQPMRAPGSTPSQAVSQDLYWPAPATEPTTSAAPAACGWTEAFMNYPGNDLRTVTGVSSASDCCQQCALEPECRAWTYGEASCYLKGSRPRAVLTKVRDVHFTSGQPTQVNRFISTSLAAPGKSLFCFALMLPYSYEGQLLSFQFQQGISLFACDEYAVYSNLTLEVAPGLETRTVASNLVCTRGGEFKTALNTDIFLAVWARVVGDGRFRYHDWTVKVDPDCVFFPARLRGLVVKHKEVPGGVYLNNCKMGMHGPLEVFSRNAVGVWWGGVVRCRQHFDQLCSGPCQWGEDMFVDQCLMKVLHVKREFEGTLLQEDHCDPPPGWMSCGDSKVTAFHPFKSVAGYQACREGSLR